MLKKDVPNISFTQNLGTKWMFQSKYINQKKIKIKNNFTQNLFQQWPRCCVKPGQDSWPPTTKIDVVLTSWPHDLPLKLMPKTSGPRILKRVVAIKMRQQDVGSQVHTFKFRGGHSTWYVRGIYVWFTTCWISSAFGLWVFSPFHSSISFKWYILGQKSLRFKTPIIPRRSKKTHKKKHVKFCFFSVSPHQTANSSIDLLRSADSRLPGPLSRVASHLFISFTHLAVEMFLCWFKASWVFLVGFLILAVAFLTYNIQLTTNTRSLQTVMRCLCCFVDALSGKAHVFTFQME